MASHFFLPYGLLENERQEVPTEVPGLQQTNQQIGHEILPRRQEQAGGITGAAHQHAWPRVNTGTTNSEGRWIPSSVEAFPLHASPFHHHWRDEQVSPAASGSVFTGENPVPQSHPSQTQTLPSRPILPWVPSRPSNSLPIPQGPAAPTRVPAARGDQGPQFHVHNGITAAGNEAREGGRNMNNTCPPRNTPTDQNSSIWITNLPVGITEKIMLDAITAFGPFGKIYSTEIIAGGPGPLFKHRLSACAIAFFDRASAKALLTFILNRNFRIQGQLVSDAYWNKKIVIPPALRSACSRVLIIQGPKTIVDIHRLEEYPSAASANRSRFWKTQDIVEVPGGVVGLNSGGDLGVQGHRTLIWTFASYVGQAESVSMALREGPLAVRVLFGADPVEFGPVTAVEMNRRASSFVIQ